MIRVDKGPAPKELQSHEVDLAIEKVDEFYRSGNRTQKRYKFPFKRAVDKSLKPTLHKRFHGKCGYCETKILSIEAGVIDRFRPHNGVRDKKKYYSDLYWWLVYEWENLVYSCRECSEYKANYFPILKKRAEYRKNSIEAEEHLLLNPFTDTPEHHMGISETSGELYSITERGGQTIELLNLNRLSLVEGRLNAIDQVEGIIRSLTQGLTGNKEKTIGYLNKVYDKNQSVGFLFAAHSYLSSRIDSTQFIASYLTNYDDDLIDERKLGKDTRQKQGVRKPIKRTFFPIEYVEIKNFKAISRVRFDFPKNELDQHSWIAVLGENGLGKSSILQAFCLGLKPLFKSGESIIESLIKNGKDEATITVKERNSENKLVTRLIRDGNRVEHSGVFESSIIGYGATRLLPDHKDSFRNNGKKAISYGNLFNPAERLSNVHGWLHKIYSKNPDEFVAIAVALKKLLPDEVDDNLVMKKDRLTFGKSNAAFESLSDGYKNTISLALDIMYKLSEGPVDIDKLNGFVVIDELGNQLHPRWQMRVVEQLREVFPRVNFIISTHHPLCLRGLMEDETIVMKKNPNTGRVRAVSDLPFPDEFRVDQLLTSEFFGLATTNGTELESNFNEYYYLLAQNERTALQEARLEFLRAELKDRKHLGGTLREELMYSVIDELLAKRLNDGGLLDRGQLKEETIKRVRKLWNKEGLLD